MAGRVKVVGLGGSLRAESTSRTALQAALNGAASSGANVELIWLRDLHLPFYTAERDPGRRAPARRDRVRLRRDDLEQSDVPRIGQRLIQNALDWLILLADRTPPYLSNKPVGLVSTAGGVQGLQTINSMDFIARALRGWSVPLVLPVPHSRQSFDPDGNLRDEAITSQLRALGAEVVRAARQFQTEGTCDYADDRQFQPDGAAR